MCVCLLYATTIPCVAAFDHGYALGPIRDSGTGQDSARQGAFIQCFFVFGGMAATVSGNLLGPLMGISSILWLMMRNDSAINPRLAWM